MDITVIVPLYNENESLPELTAWIDRVMAENGFSYEVLMVDDGSTDGSWDTVRSLAQANPAIHGISFRRNYGKSAALYEGFAAAAGDVVITMDADLQHPPAMIPEILERFREGYDIINMVRTRNETAGFAKNLTSGLFYRLINRISDVRMEPAASDFFAMDAAAADVLRHSYREKVRFLRGFVQNIGFRKTTICLTNDPMTSAPKQLSALRELAYMYWENGCNGKYRPCSF